MPQGRPYPAATRAAVEAALLGSDEPMTAIAVRFGLAYGTVRDWNRASGIRLTVRRHPVDDALRGRGGARDLPDLRAALREHVGRQIAALDARLCRAGAEADTGRMLRDLAGLKRLLDELAQEAAGEETTQRDDGDADGVRQDPAMRDLAVLRETIARRYEAFSGERLDEDVPGEPGAPARGGARG